jgi:hypothetical protein
MKGNILQDIYSCLIMAIITSNFYCECEKCHTINTSEDKNYFVSNNTCKYCGATLDTSMGKLKSYLTPIYGFVADRKNKESRRIKPFKTMRVMFII